MFNKEIKMFMKKNTSINTETYLFFSSSLIFYLLNYLSSSSRNESVSYLILLVLVTIFGLPHGALDTMLAKKFKIYYNTKSFILFNLTYLMLALTVFFFWSLFSVLALYAFLLISGYHFSEDWKNSLKLYERLFLGFGVLNLPLFFHLEEVNVIYSYITISSDILFYSKIQYFIAFINLLCMLFLALKNLRFFNILLQISIIIIFSYLLDPIYFFISYFCFI